MPKLYRLDIRLSGQDSGEMLTGLLAMELAAGWEEDTEGAWNIFRVHSENPDFLRLLISKIKAMLPDAEASICEVEKKDWMSAWRQFFTPVVCGDHFVVLPPWRAAEDFGKLVKILIEPASAFGTGHHATTALCLSALGNLLDEGHLRPGQTFLDLGCGSGILGIGAALSKLGGLGLDIDILAIDNALANRSLNKVDNLELACGGLELAGNEPRDLLMANILAGPLIEMAPAICGGPGQKGLIMLSGILDRQADEVANAYEHGGKKLLKTMKMGEWRLLLLA